MTRVTIHHGLPLWSPKFMSYGIPNNLKSTTGQLESIDRPLKKDITPSDQLVMFSQLRKASRSLQDSIWIQESRGQVSKLG
jgi:hypothetical protein